MDTSTWLRDGGRLRAPWRILAYLALLFVFTLVGEFAIMLLPRHPLGWATLAITTAAALGAGWVVLARLDNRAPGALGFAWTGAVPREVGVGLLVGVVLIGSVMLLLVALGAARYVSDVGTGLDYLWLLLWTLVYFGLAAAYEEAVFRGYAFQALVEGIGVWPAILISSALFSGFHAWNPDIDSIAFVNIFLAGVMLSLAYLRTRSLWFATALHAGWNWALASLFALPVSGLTFIDTPLYDAVETGADWWTGGNFGPEAGLAGTLALLLGIAWLLRTGVLNEAPRMKELRPLVDSRLREAAR